MIFNWGSALLFIQKNKMLIRTDQQSHIYTHYSLNMEATLKLIKHEVWISLNVRPNINLDRSDIQVFSESDFIFYLKRHKPSPHAVFFNPKSFFFLSVIFFVYFQTLWPFIWAKGILMFPPSLGHVRTFVLHSENLVKIFTYWSLMG